MGWRKRGKIYEAEVEDKQTSSWVLLWLAPFLCEAGYEEQVTFLSHKIFNRLPFHVIGDVANEHSVTVHCLLIGSARALLLRIGVESIPVSERRNRLGL